MKQGFTLILTFLLTYPALAIEVFEDVKFFETRQKFLNRRPKSKPEGDMVRTDLQFGVKSLSIVGKESTYSAITTIDYTNIKSILYEFVEKETDTKKTKVLLAATLINPVFALSSTKEKQHWVRVDYLDDQGQQAQAMFELEDEAEMKIKWLLQAKTSLYLEHRENGTLPSNSVQPGMTAFDVIQLLGDPLRVVHFGDKVIFYYEKRILGIEARLWFENGVLADFQ